jgi:subtilisin family serine protease
MALAMRAVDVRGTRRRRIVWAGAVILAGTLVVPNGAMAAGNDPGGGAAAVTTSAVASGGRWVTLVTGDRVLLDRRGDKVVKTTPGPGRAGMNFRIFNDSGDTFVMPMDALPLLGRGLVDRRLFDVSGLLRAGYDDQHRADVPLIVSAAPGKAMTAVRSRMSVGRATVSRELPGVSAVAVRQDKKKAAAFWDAVSGGSARRAGLAPELGKIWLDGPVRATLDKSVSQVGAPQAWKAGHTGRGATVAVLDSGIDETHPDLADAVAGEKDFTNSEDGTKDGFGHGTHVASIITGGRLPVDGKYVGVAPDAKLLVGKVLNDSGSGSDSSILAGMEWAAAQGARVVNMSLGTDFAGDGAGVLDEAVNRLTAETGTLFVVSAGNFGPDTESISSPGSADAALTVGAVDGSDELAAFSSRGPRETNPSIKPEITAPGVGIVAARAAGTDLGRSVDERYTALSGTSMAAPSVAGAAAILAGQHPDWKADRLKSVLMGAAKPNDDLTVYEQGAGRLDVARADGQQVYATPAEINDGVASWPHADDHPVATPVTYHNDAESPVTLDLALDVKDPDGEPAAGGMFSVSAAKVTVPAGGDSTVTVTADTTGPGRDGLYGGVLTATGESGGVSVRTPIGITKEVKSHDVTLKVTNHDGAPTGEYFAEIFNIAQKQIYRPYDASGTVTVRLPDGTYFLHAGVFTLRDEGQPDMTTFLEPSFTVSGDSTLRLDALQGRRAGVTVDRPDAKTGSFQTDFERKTSWGSVAEFDVGSALENFLLRPSTTSAPAGQFTFKVEANEARPAPGGNGFAGPYQYHAQWTQDGRVPEQLVRHVPDREMAVVDSTFGATSAGSNGNLLLVNMPLPGRLTQYYSPGVPTDNTFAENDTAIQLSVDQELRAGHHYQENWNSAVFGPADPTADPSFPLLERQIDQLIFDVPFFSDQVNNHAGASVTDSANTTLYRDGQKIGESPFPGAGVFTLPAGRASYELRTSATRSVSQLSTRVDATYTFRSARSDLDDAIPLPALGIRLAPRLDTENRAPGGRTFTFPVHVGRQPGAAPYGRLKTFTVDVSYDDGRTWQPAHLTGDGDHRTVTVEHPAGPGYVSLRAKATDTAGNGIEETIIHAYALTAG